jgi:hypothetical protein
MLLNKYVIFLQKKKKKKKERNCIILITLLFNATSEHGFFSGIQNSISSFWIVAVERIYYSESSIIIQHLDLVLN